MAKYKGSQCKGNCGGHKAGAAYARRGGRTLTYSSPSFNKGMRIEQAAMKAKGKRTRMAINKRISK
jgi:hypothetical protein